MRAGAQPQAEHMGELLCDGDDGFDAASALDGLDFAWEQTREMSELKVQLAGQKQQLDQQQQQIDQLQKQVEQLLGGAGIVVDIPPSLETKDPDESDVDPRKTRRASGDFDAQNDRAEGDLVVEVPLSENSLWGAAPLAFLPQYSGTGTSALLWILILLNIAIEGAVCVFIAMFLVAPLPDHKDLLSLRHWRLSVAHDPGYMNANSTTLIERICAGDPSVSQAESKLELLENMAQYQEGR